VLSSNATNIPGCFEARAALTNACRAKTVFPHPAPPITNVVRPAGNPPSVISSNPVMPDAILTIDERALGNFIECVRTEDYASVHIYPCVRARGISPTRHEILQIAGSRGASQLKE
jgi:hypothetical protein